MKKFLVVTIIFFCSHYILSAQLSPADYKTGYALKGADTIPCKVGLSSGNNSPKGAIRLLINDDELTVLPGGPITGFGAEINGEWYHYGTVTVETKLGTQRRSSTQYLKKIVAGTIDLYEYSYLIYTTRKVTVNGEEKPGSASSSSQTYTDYYIAKTDSTAVGLAAPVLLPSFRKKDLEPYISDNAALWTIAEKKYNLKELIVLLKEYNSWFQEKKKL